MRRAVIAITVVLAGILGPRLSAPRDRGAGEPFVFEPPEGFIEAKGEAKQGDEDEEWVNPAPSPNVLHVTPRIMLKRSKSGGTVEPSDLAAIASGMPQVLEPSGVTWKDVRQETRVRPDGARVGLIEGECSNKNSIRYRRLFFVFPVDGGTVITTSIYGNDEVAKWQPVLEGTIAKAHGVALRVPPPPNWMYVAWGGAGLVIGYLVSALVMRKREEA
jgi:hypothetical protein